MQTFASALRDVFLRPEDPLKTFFAAVAGTHFLGMEQLKLVHHKKPWRNLLSGAVSQMDCDGSLDNLLIFPDWSMRKVVTSNLVHRLMSHNILYVRGTPASGKTVLLNLLHQELLTQHPALRVVSIGSWPQSMNSFQSKKYIEQLLGMALSNPAVIPPTVLLVDEAQSTKEDQYLWNTFLKLLVQPAPSNLRVAMFAAYGSAGNTPVEIPLHNAAHPASHPTR